MHICVHVREREGLRVSVFLFWLLEMPCAFESFSSFASALEELLDDLEAAHTGLLSGVAVRRVFSPSIKDHALYLDMLRCIRELEFWNHLKKLLICIDKCSEVDKVVQKWGSQVIKIQDVFHEITEELGVVCRNNNNSKDPLEALDDVLHDLEAKFGLFKQETGEALDCLSLLSTCYSLGWSVPLLAFLLKEFLMSISGILESIRRECEHDKEVQVLARERMWNRS